MTYPLAMRSGGTGSRLIDSSFDRNWGAQERTSADVGQSYHARYQMERTPGGQARTLDRRLKIVVWAVRRQYARRERPRRVYRLTAKGRWATDSP